MIEQKVGFVINTRPMRSSSRVGIVSICVRSMIQLCQLVPVGFLGLVQELLLCLVQELLLCPICQSF